MKHLKFNEVIVMISIILDHCIFILFDILIRYFVLHRFTLPTDVLGKQENQVLKGCILILFEGRHLINFQTNLSPGHLREFIVNQSNSSRQSVGFV